HNQTHKTQKNQKHMNTKRIIGLIGLAVLAMLGWSVVSGHWAMALDLGTSAVALAAVPVVVTEEQLREFQGILGELQGGWGEIKNLPAMLKSVQNENAELKQ